MKILIVGLGSIGKRHIKTMLKLGIKKNCIVGFDVRKDRVEEANKNFGIKTLNTNFSKIKEKEFNGAIICSPTSLHIKQSIYLAKKKINLFIEKPLCNNLNGIKKLQHLVKKNKLKVLINYPFRFSEHAQKLKYLIDKKTLGKVLYFRGEFSEYLPDWHPWEDYRKFYMAFKSQGGGSILDQSHIIDMAHFLFGDMKEVLGCFNSKVSRLEVKSDDIAEILLKFRNGLVGNIHQDMIGRHHKKEMTIICEKGNIFWNVYDLSVTLYYPNGKQKKYKFKKDHNIMYNNQAKHMIKILNKKEKPKISLIDGIHTLKVINSAEKSHKIKRSVII
jgi:predicted dehydrogenase